MLGMNGNGEGTYVSAAAPILNWTFLMPSSACLEVAILTNSGSNSRPVTVPAGPTA